MNIENSFCFSWKSQGQVLSSLHNEKNKSFWGEGLTATYTFCVSNYFYRLLEDIQ